MIHSIYLKRIPEDFDISLKQKLLNNKKNVNVNINTQCT